MSLPSINSLHLTVSEMQPRQTFSRRPPPHLDTMDENNTTTALKGCGVKITVFQYLHIPISMTALGRDHMRIYQRSPENLFKIPVFIQSDAWMTWGTTKRIGDKCQEFFCWVQIYTKSKTSYTRICLCVIKIQYECCLLGVLLTHLLFTELFCHLLLFPPQLFHHLFLPLLLLL